MMINYTIYFIHHISPYINIFFTKGGGNVQNIYIFANCVHIYILPIYGQTACHIGDGDFEEIDEFPKNS